MRAFNTECYGGLFCWLSSRRCLVLLSIRTEVVIGGLRLLGGGQSLSPDLVFDSRRHLLRASPLCERWCDVVHL